MIVKYNSLDKTESPILTLCNPGSVYTNGYLTNVVGILTDCEAEEIIFNFNALSELNFRINYIERGNSEESVSIKNLYNSVKNRRLIFIDNIGYFSITNIDDKFENGMQYKDVKAQSIECELQQKQIPYIENGTYKFMTESGETSVGIFNKIVEILPLWTIGHVDSTVKTKWRTFEDVDTSLNCLGFLLENIQNAYECIIIFNIVNRTINVYDQSNYVRKTNIQITKDDIIKSLTVTENADDIYTAISARGNDELSIAAINPVGGSVIYNFNYYLPWMSASLRAKVNQWQQAVNNAKSSYYQANLNYYNKLQEVSDLQSEINMLDLQITLYKRCKDNIVANSNTSFVSTYNADIVNAGGTQVVIYNEIADTLNALTQQINSRKTQKTTTQSSLSTARSQLTSYSTTISNINSQLSINNYFTSEEYGELANYIFEGSYTDDYVKVTDVMTYSEKFAQMKLLYDRAEAQLLKASEPSQQFDVDSESVIFEKSFSHWNDQLETGCLINVEINKNDCAWLFLSTITVNYDDKNLKFTFGNRFNKYDTKSLFDNVLGSISKSANTLQYIKDILYPLKDGTLDEMKESIQSSRDITMSDAITSQNEEVVIDSSGYTGKTLLPNGQYDPQQIKITGKNIVFTDDNWSTSKLAIGSMVINNTNVYGINAQAVMGELLIGENLLIQNQGQTLRVDSNGLSAYNNTNSISLNPAGSTLFSIKNGNHEVLGLKSDGSLYIEADGAGINLTTNSTIQGLSSSIAQTANEIKSTVGSAANKYDTTGKTVNIYGYGVPESMSYDAGEYNGRYYLNQLNGYLYMSNGSKWVYQERLTLITSNLQTSITQTQRDIVSMVNAATSLYDTSHYTIDIYGYGAPDNETASGNNNKLYLNQKNGYLYKSNGSEWVYQSALTLITANLQSQIIQNATSITTKVSASDLGTQIQQNASSVKIAWNQISQYVQFEDFNNKASIGIYDSIDTSTKKILIRISPNGLNIYNGASTNALIMKLCNTGMKIYDATSTIPLGNIGTNFVTNTNYKGIVFDLDTNASYMAWAYQSASDSSYMQKWTYWAEEYSGVAEADTLNAGCPIDMHSKQIRNSILKSWKFITASDSSAWFGYTGTLNIGGYGLVFHNGVLRTVSSS